MPGRKIVFLASIALALAALLAGCLLVAACGFGPPPWLLRLEIVAFSLLAASYGFAATRATLRPLVRLLRLRPVQGAMLVVGGVASVYVPPNFLAAAVMLGLGTRLVWAEACELAEAGRSAATIRSNNPGPVAVAAASPDPLPPGVPASPPARLRV